MINYINPVFNKAYSGVSQVFTRAEEAISFGVTPRSNMDIAVKAATISTCILVGPQMRLVTLVAYFTLSILYGRLEKLLSDPKNITFSNLQKLLSVLFVWNKVKKSPNLVEKLAKFWPFQKSILHWFLGVPKKEAGTFTEGKVSKQKEEPSSKKVSKVQEAVSELEEKETKKQEGKQDPHKNPGLFSWLFSKTPSVKQQEGKAETKLEPVANPLNLTIPLDPNRVEKKLQELIQEDPYSSPLKMNPLTLAQKKPAKSSKLQEVSQQEMDVIWKEFYAPDTTLKETKASSFELEQIWETTQGLPREDEMEAIWKEFYASSSLPEAFEDSPRVILPLKELTLSPPPPKKPLLPSRF